MQDDAKGTNRPTLGRRELMKLGAGVVATAWTAPTALAQDSATQAVPVATRTGYKNDYGRRANGPMDDTVRKIVEYVDGFSESDLTDSLVHALNRTMVDTMAALVAGFEDADKVRICARLARQVRGTDEQATVMGYGITTSPELAAFANSALVRATDFNDHGPAGHASDVIPTALAMGEALHSSGAEVMQAITVAYEIRGAGIGGNMEAIAAAMAAGKIMKLDVDHLADAVGLALVPHVPLNKGVGALSMWKGVRSAEAVKCGIWAALMAREGMTGPPQPFEGRGSLWAVYGRGPDFKLPKFPKTCVERMGFKRFPAEASSQACLEIIPEMREWTTPDEIESVKYEMSFSNWEEIADAPKWDPRNRDTADHSMPYILARALIDGEIYLNSFDEDKYMAPEARGLMDRMAFFPSKEFENGNGQARITIRKKSGEEKVFNTLGGRKTRYVDDSLEDGSDAYDTPMTDDEIRGKFTRVCDYKQVSPQQRDRALAIWGDLRNVADIGEAIRTMATFGRAQPL